MNDFILAVQRDYDFLNSFPPAFKIIKNTNNNYYNNNNKSIS